mmetsp:Transcript_145590/g.254046  ORF Transcript_145590/g.254046 Transcript_145590/m.254046 type:complete len:219 (+) Transcript_145590:575-1231(+)
MHQGVPSLPRHVAVFMARFILINASVLRCGKVEALYQLAGMEELAQVGPASAPRSLQEADCELRDVAAQEAEGVGQGVQLKAHLLSAEDFPGDQIGLIDQRTYAVQRLQERSHGALWRVRAQLLQEGVDLLELHTILLLDFCNSRCHVQTRNCTSGQHAWVVRAYLCNLTSRWLHQSEGVGIPEDDAIIVVHAPGSIISTQRDAIHKDSRSGPVHRHL